MGNCCHLKYSLSRKQRDKSPSKIVPNQNLKAWNNDWGNYMEDDFGHDQEEDSEVDFLMIPEMKIELQKQSPRIVENPENPHPLYSAWHYMEDEEPISSASITNEFKAKSHHLEHEEASTYSHIQDVSLNKTILREDLGSEDENSGKHNEFYAKKVKKTFIKPESKEINKKEGGKNNKKGIVTEQRLRLNRISYDKAETRTKKWNSSDGRQERHGISYREESSSNIQNSSDISPLWQNISYQENKSHDLLSLILKRHHSKTSSYEEEKDSTDYKTHHANEFKNSTLRSSNNSPNPPNRIPSTDNISASISYNRQGSSLSTTKPSFRLPTYPRKGVISPDTISKAYLEDNLSQRATRAKKQL